jgi:hypothetical protein
MRKMMLAAAMLLAGCSPQEHCTAVAFWNPDPRATVHGMLQKSIFDEWQNGEEVYILFGTKLWIGKDDPDGRVRVKVLSGEHAGKSLSMFRGYMKTIY